MSDQKSLEEIMLASANEMARLIQSETASNGEKIKAFDGLTVYYLGAQKMGGGSAPRGDKTEHFGELRDKIHRASGANGSDESASAV